MKVMLISAFLLSSAGSSFGAAALSGSAVIRQNTLAPEQVEQTGQKQWDEDVQKTFQKLQKLKRELTLLTHENNGLKALLEGNPARAASDYDALLSLAPDQTEARVYRASSRSKLGDLEGALADYTLALKQAATDLAAAADGKSKKRTQELIARIYGDRASTYMRLGLRGKGDAASFERALEDCDQAVRVGHPRPSLMIWQRSQILFSAARYAQAAQAYQQALTVDPKLMGIADHALFCRKFADEKISIGSCN